MKKLQPKLTKLTAEAQADALEASFQKLSQPETQPPATAKAPAAAPKKKAAPHSRKPVSAGRKARSADLPPTKREGRTRITVDLPDEIYSLLELNKEENGQSITHLVASLLKKHFAKKG